MSMAEENLLGAWGDGFQTAVRQLRQPTAGLLPPPAGEPCAERLAVLLEGYFRDLQVHPYSEQAIEDAAKVLAGLGQAGARESLHEAALRVGGAVETEISRCLDAGFQDPRLVRTGDFATVTFYGTSPHQLAAGVGATLPPQHRLGELLAGDKLEVPMPTNGARVILLRPVADSIAGPARARPFYFVSHSLQLTRAEAGQQKSQREENARVEAAYERRNQLTAEQQLYILQRRLAELERR
jgi:hypothetical protein